MPRNARPYLGLSSIPGLRVGWKIMENMPSRETFGNCMKPPGNPLWQAEKKAKCKS